MHETIIQHVGMLNATIFTVFQRFMGLDEQIHEKRKKSMWSFYFQCHSLQLHNSLFNFFSIIPEEILEP